MAQTGSVWVKWITLTDRDTVVGSRLFGGSPIYAYSVMFKMTGKSNYGNDPRIMPTIDYINNVPGSVYRENLGRNSYTGYENSVINLAGNWTTDLGSTTDMGDKLLTPYKMVLLATSGKQLYLKDERVIEQMIVESGSTFYTEYGMPVVIDTWSFDYSNINLNLVSWTLTLKEDK
jgi:TfoX/Sxy family transcriptional regulator of competence genes